jgi:hypothetical protein
VGVGTEWRKRVGIEPNSGHTSVSLGFDRPQKVSDLAVVATNRIGRRATAPWAHFGHIGCLAAGLGLLVLLAPSAAAKEPRPAAPADEYFAYFVRVTVSRPAGEA